MYDAVIGCYNNFAILPNQAASARRIMTSVLAALVWTPPPVWIPPLVSTVSVQLDIQVCAGGIRMTMDPSHSLRIDFANMQVIAFTSTRICTVVLLFYSDLILRPQLLYDHLIWS